MFTVDLGQAWKRDTSPSGVPHDAIALEFDGVNVLPRVAEESLPRVVSELVGALKALVTDKDRSAQVSLEESNLELCWWRTRALEVELQVIDFGQPPRRVGPVQHLELAELKDGIVKCARSFIRDSGGAFAGAVELERQLKAVDATVLDELSPRHPEPWRFEHGDERLAVCVHDEVGRLTSWLKKSRGALSSLLLEGQLQVGSTRVECLPFLELQRLARAAAADERVTLAGHSIDPRAVFELGLEFVVGLRRHHPPAAANPYLESLQVRCIDGLAARRTPAPVGPRNDDAPPPAAAAAKGAGAPLIRQGAARRVAMQPTWSATVALGEEGGHLQVSRSAVIVSSAHAVQMFTPAGRSTFRRLANRGLATSGAGDVVCSTSTKLLGFAKRRKEAAWVRDHDGVLLGPSLTSVKNVGVALLNGRGAWAVDLITGRELWRFDPTRTQRSFMTVHGARTMLATDGGSIFGLDTVDGQTRFRIRAALPAVAAPVMVGHRALCVLSQNERTTVVLFEAHGVDGAPAGQVTWSADLTLAHPCPPVPSKQRVYVAGLAEGKTQVICLDGPGHVLWQRAVACDGRTVRLVAFESGVIASDARGVAVRLLPDGQVDWVLGAEGDELSRPLGPVIVRKLLVLPGPDLRVVEPLTGRVLGALEVGAHLTDFAVDTKFTIYAYAEPGVLRAFAPATTLSVV